MKSRKLWLFAQALSLLGMAFFMATKYVEINSVSKTTSPSISGRNSSALSVKDNLNHGQISKDQIASINFNSNTKFNSNNIPSATSGSVTIYNENLSSNGINLYPVSGTAEVLLVSMDGQLLHKWNVDAERARLLPNGNLLVIHGSKWGKDVEPWRGLRNRIREYTWDGEIAWEHKASDVAHHDLQRLDNGNTAYLRRTILPLDYKKKIADINKRKLDIRADSIVEITNAQEKVWEWHTYEHLDLNSCGRRPCREVDDESLAADKDKDWTHVNTLSIIPENKWHKNGDQRFKPGNIIFLPRNFWTVYIADRDTGKIVWEYGGDYRGGISGGHEASMIPEGLPGAGNIMILDNGTKVHQGESFILEVDPQTKKIAWVFDAGKKFFTATRGSVQRLPNGNTLISEDNTGRLFEVTPNQEIVWEFKSSNLSSRARRYPMDYCPQFKNLLDK